MGTVTMDEVVDTGQSTDDHAPRCGDEVMSEKDIDISLVVGIEPTEGKLVCKFNLCVMPGMPRSWCVMDTKRWKMMATCCGDLGSCSMACLQSLMEYGKSRPFVYVTV